MLTAVKDAYDDFVSHLFLSFSFPIPFVLFLLTAIIENLFSSASSKPTRINFSNGIAAIRKLIIESHKRCVVLAYAKRNGLRFKLGTL